MIALPHLETNVTVACQNRCIACNHFVPLQVRRFKASMMDPAVLERDLRNMARISHAEAWAAIGGEPTLHPELPALLRVARRSRVADCIEVWTNGQDLQGLVPQFWEQCDRLVVSAYPGKVTERELRWLERRCSETGTQYVLKDEATAPNFTRLLVPKATRVGPVQERYNRCWFRTYSRVIDNGVFYRCCTSPFIAPLLMGLSWGFDGLPIDASTTAARLQRYLDEPGYMMSCTRCAGRNTDEATAVPWREVSNPAEWVAASGGSA
jgi:GTP 3',8-cyclase